MGEYLVDVHAVNPFVGEDAHDQMCNFLRYEVNFDSLAQSDQSIAALADKPDLTKVISHTGLRTDLLNKLIEVRTTVTKRHRHVIPTS